MYSACNETCLTAHNNFISISSRDIETKWLAQYSPNYGHTESISESLLSYPDMIIELFHDAIPNVVQVL